MTLILIDYVKSPSIRKN